MDWSGSVLDECLPVESAGVMDGASLTLHMSRLQMKSTQQAFAAVPGDASVVTWGDARHGGDSRIVQDKLKNVQQIHASSGAFADILGDGCVVTWGFDFFGGDSRSVQDQ